jgi:excisionase family DNA binding protein
LKPVKLISVSEAAWRYGVTRRTVLKWITAGKLKAEKYGAYWLVGAGQRRPVSKAGRPRKAIK